MLRISGTTTGGNVFNDVVVEAVWCKGVIIPGLDPTLVRQDACGAIMDRYSYGDTSTPSGWEIDHVQPIALGGTDDPWNLQPLRWQNNRWKADNWPTWSCAVGS